MKVSDLMIGDWVAAKGIDKPFRVVYITYSAMKEQLCIFGKTSDGIRVGPFLSKEIQPIPLTREILHHNVPDPDMMAWWEVPSEDNYFHFEYSGDEYDFEVGINIHYVHELQHAIRLCGIDKEIIL